MGLYSICYTFVLIEEAEAASSEQDLPSMETSWGLLTKLFPSKSAGRASLAEPSFTVPSFKHATRGLC